MWRRLFFLIGLASAVYGGWLVHHEQRINDACNANTIDPKNGVTVSSQCLNVVWPYSAGFLCLILGGLCVFAGLMLSRRVMAGERQYMKDLKSGKYSHENDHLNAYHFHLVTLRPPLPTGVPRRTKVSAPDVGPED